MRLQGLVFDVDGTLAETEETHRIAFNETFAAAGLGWHWSREDYFALIQTTGGKERMRRHRDDLGQSRPDNDTIAALHAEKTGRYAALLGAGGLSLRPGVAALVEGARRAGLKLAVATTTNRPNVDTLCRACWNAPAEDVFDVIAAGDEVAHKKPAADVYELALARLGLPAASCIAFEDSENGVRAARAAGLRVLATPSIYTRDDDFSASTWRRETLERRHLPEDLAAVA
ncbi:HAD-IA family hydrolase [Tropicimonas sp. IMCC6043]|uniref:HAD-IA family hydrolase n=1 Tax=Tropicimonas sp. IMCC6043 TaxID=2510645 RepID=UPI00101CD798|nr:HAD-IA family hydrolase [Tropicimonas sp. IMCC6043]RYH07739.1 HAD family hydrolase [Tropicimonas sp. IMCC6043]